MKFVYCSRCGLKLSISRKAIPRASTIVDIVDYHVCGELQGPDFEFNPTQPFIAQAAEERKFEQKINELAPPPLPAALADDPGDRRSSDSTKSAAPLSILDQIKALKDLER